MANSTVCTEKGLFTMVIILYLSHQKVKMSNNQKRMLPSLCKSKNKTALIESNIHTTNVNRFHLSKNRHMVNGLVDVL